VGATSILLLSVGGNVVEDRAVSRLIEDAGQFVDTAAGPIAAIERRRVCSDKFAARRIPLTLSGIPRFPF
jgi:hypothetical protein